MKKVHAFLPARFHRATLHSSCLALAGLVSLSVMLTGCGGGGGVSASLPVSVPTSSAAGTSAVSTGGTTGGTDDGRAAWGCSVRPLTPNFASETDPVAHVPNALYHWDSLPVRIAFMNNGNATLERQKQAMAGFDEWPSAIGQAIMYTVVSDPAQAQIVVRFEERGQTSYGAITEYGKMNGNRLQSATITFNLTYLKDGRTLTPAAAHEFGHALGIAGHSNDPSDVMCATQDAYKHTALSVRDVNTLRAAYCGTSGRVSASEPSAKPATIYCRVGMP